MDSNAGADWISQLPTELLLRIYQCDLPPGTLSRCMCCCRRWRSVASLVLYKHVGLDMQGLSRWINSGSASNDVTIETLTVRITEAGTGTATARAPPDHALRQLRLDLDRLAERLRHMGKLRSLSIHAPARLPRGLWVPEPSLANVLNNVPGTCSSLEIDLSDVRYSGHPSKNETHLCSSVRRLLPQLRFLRLSLPNVCPEIFGSRCDPTSAIAPAFTPSQAPRLQEVTIKLFGASPVIRRSQGCSSSDASVVRVLIEHLQTFARSGGAPSLRKLWVLDGLPQKLSFDSYAAVVRRDVLADISQTLPMKNISPGRKENDGFLIRMPAEDGAGDMLSTLEGIQMLAEKDTWIAAANGTRLPSTVMEKEDGLTPAGPIIRTAEEWRATSEISTILWEEESKTSQRLLEAETGGLLEDRVSFIRVPEGWRRDLNGFGLERID